MQLFTPLQLGPISVPNRIAVAPMAQYSARDGCAGTWHLQHLMRLAMSGAGLVMVESSAVERVGRAAHSDLGLYNDACEEALAVIMAPARSVAPRETKFGVQLGHAGRKASVSSPWEGGRPLGSREDRWATIAPSAVAFAPGWECPREMSEDDIASVLDRYRQAAARAVRIGFDVIEIHMAHGYLVHSFQSPLTNLRNDRWGGDAERRLAFPLAVADAVMKAVPSHIAVGARITGSDWSANGLTSDDAVALARQLALRGFAYVCVSSGGIIPNAHIDVKRNYQVPFASDVKKKVGVVTRAVGMIVSADQAESIIASGDADQVAIARALIDDPNWVLRAADAAGIDLDRPHQYARASRKSWQGHPRFMGRNR